MADEHPRVPQRRAGAEYYRRLVDAAPYGIFACDPKGRLTHVNRAAEDIAGRPASELLGLFCLTLVVEEDRAAAIELSDRLFSGEVDRGEVDLRIRRPNGEGRLIAVAASPQRDEGEAPTGVHGVARDITAERARQEKVRRVEQLANMGTLLGGVAHELNNPLQAIRGFTELLLDEEADAVDPGEAAEERRDLLETIQREAERASRIVSDLRLLARRTSGGPGKSVPVHLNELVRHVVKVRSLVARADEVRMRTRLQRGLPLVAGDPSRLEQVLTNLVVNAEQALAGVERERILTLATEKRGEEVILTVEDNGPGIPAEHRTHLFDAFWSTKEAGEGMGLGLHLVHTLIEEHGGHIDVESEIGSGTRFVIHLPATNEKPEAEPDVESETEPEAGLEAESAPRRAVERPAGERWDARQSRPTFRTALVIDDDDTIREMLGSFLARRGFAVEQATNGVEALRMIDRSTDAPHDVVFTDLRMPGLRPTVLMRALQDRGMTNRLVVMTGDAASLEGETVLRGTTRPVLLKPFSLGRVDRVLADLMRPREPTP